MKNISEAKSELSKLVELALSGEEVIIAKAGKAVVRLTVYAGPMHARQPGALRGKILIDPDFDALPDDVAQAFGVK